MNNRITHLLNEPVALKGAGILITAKPHRARTRGQSLRYAVQGLQEAWMTQPNLRLQVAIAGVVVAAGLRCELSLLEWLWISFAIGLVIFAELMNTAIEQTVDLVVGLRPDPFARRVKDVAAGCVLVAAILAGIIGLLTFSSHLIASIHSRLGV